MKTTNYGVINSAGYVAVDQAVPEAGAIIYWRLSGDADLGKLTEQWTVVQGLPPDLLPAPAEAPRALRRAVRECARGNSRRLVRPLEKRQGYALVHEAAAGDELAYDVGVRVKVAPSGDALLFDPEDHPRRPAIEDAFRRQLGTVTQGDFGNWLCRLMRTVDAVSLRDTGGVYFVPRHRLGLWRLMVAAIRGCSDNVVLGIPAMPVDDTIDAVVDGISSEALSECESLERDVRCGDLGERALEGRLSRANEAEEKIGRYEAIVGRNLGELRSRLERARASIAAAILQAQADEDAVAS